MSVLPIVAIVLVLHLTVAPLDPTALYAFLIGSLLVVGLTIFLFGVDQGLEPIGNFAGFDFMAIAFDASGLRREPLPYRSCCRWSTVFQR